MILSVLFWRFPRQPRGSARTTFDSLALAVATAAAFAGMHWGMRNADASYGAMWPQVLATSVAYGLYLTAMTVALLIRMRWLRRRPSPLPGAQS
ncbi:hypothetical protein [Marilutibacter alkalisoli]|uniref:Uncharacterized protein n=1 Tax=Marilutibacter alkalisoli TaxID=2591633 RepID=A0A514BUU7_9GAMM|nr:hypothetical protein [Lysobacter alkalisoli]QDH71137.1 hypothetical protein FKV23_14355 [Lysobacter alkalisoli]